MKIKTRWKPFTPSVQTSKLSVPAISSLSNQSPNPIQTPCLWFLWFLALSQVICFWFLLSPFALQTQWALSTLSTLSPQKWTKISHINISAVTPLKFDIAPENWWLEDYFPIWKVTNFRGELLNFRGVNIQSKTNHPCNKPTPSLVMPGTSRFDGIFHFDRELVPGRLVQGVLEVDWRSTSPSFGYKLNEYCYETPNPPENQCLEDVTFPIETVPFYGKMLIFFGGVISSKRYFGKQIPSFQVWHLMELHMLCPSECGLGAFSFS